MLPTPTHLYSVFIMSFINATIATAIAKYGKNANNGSSASNTQRDLQLSMRKPVTNTQGKPWWWIVAGLMMVLILAIGFNE
jgi:hypothetical protein